MPVSTASALVFFTNDKTTQHFLFMEWLPKIPKNTQNILNPHGF